MYSFFVLGQIPGTNIVITFSMWMQLFVLLLALALLFYVRRTNSFKSYAPPTIGSEPTAQ